MEILYAPWRDKYVKHGIKQKNPEEEFCVFCDKLSVADSINHEFILKITKHAFVILNLYPYNGGHLLILPIKHVENIEDLSRAARTEIMELMSASVVILKDILKTQGINTGINLGRASGAGLPEHLHLHIVPRWIGDTNFITTIGQTKNVSVDLQEVYKELKPAFQALKL